MDNIDFLLQSLDSHIKENEPENDLFSACDEGVEENGSEESSDKTSQSTNTTSEFDSVKKNNTKKYSNYGYEVHKNLKEANQKSVVSNFRGTTNSWKVSTPSAKSKHGVLSAPELPVNHKDVYAEPVFGLRLINPVVSSQFIQTKMVGRLAIPVSRVQNHLTVGDKNADWVIAGAVVFKSGLKTSQKGSQYCLWKISDLKQDMKQITVYLFSKAGSELWKVSLGTVVAILNASPLNKDEISGNEVTLSVRNSDQVMIWGISRDYGICKAKKKNGDNCTSFVNKSQCEFCIYHVKNEYNKFTGKRHELQSSSNLNALRNKVLGKTEIFYGGKSYTATKPAATSYKQMEKDKSLLSNLSAKTKPTGMLQSSLKLTKSDEQILEKLNSSEPKPPKTTASITQITLDEKTYSRRIDLFKDAGRKMISTGEMTRVVSKGGEKKNTFISFAAVFNSESDTKAQASNTNWKKRKIVSEKNESPSQILDNFRESHNGENNSAKKLKQSNEILDSEKISKSKILNPANVTEKNHSNVPRSKDKPVKLDDFELEITGCDTNNDSNTNTNNNPMYFKSRVNLFARKSNSELSNALHQRRRDMAKKTAIQLIKQKGGLAKTNPNRVRPDNTNKNIGHVKNTDISIDKEPPQKPGDPVKQSVLSERFIALMNAQSKHEQLIQIAADIEEQNYFNKMEKKEALEEKMLTTFKVPCKAVYCIQCKYKWFSASELCKTERHPIKVIDAQKRFFKCDNCTNRTVTLEIVPLLCCKQCGSSKWSRAPMMKEKKVNLKSDLSIRGDEVKYPDAFEQTANLNLLVPE